MTFAIGTPVIDPYGAQGFISAIKEPETKTFVLSRGMQQVRHEFEVCFESGRISVLADGIVAPFVERAKHLPAVPVDIIAKRKAAIAALQAEKQAELKRIGEETRARSDAFKAECAKRVPAWAKAVIVAELREDQSDSMSDYFGSKTVRTVILGFSTHTRDIFSEMRKHAATFAETADLATAPDSAEHREKHSMGGGYYLKNGYRHSTGWQVSKSRLYQGADSMPQYAEWNDVKPEPVKPSAEIPATPPIHGIRIEEHVHTKKGFAMFIAIMPSRVERAEYDRLLDKAKGLGGWYSRPWGGTPGGFAFKERSSAESFAGNGEAAQSIAAPCQDIAPRSAVMSSAATAAKLRELADRMQSDIDSRLADRLTNTPKRQRESGNARNEGHRLQRTQNALRALAALHDSGIVPALLAKVTTKAKAYDLMKTRIDHSRGGYYDAGIDTGEPYNNTPESAALWSIVGAASEADKAAETLRRKVQSLQFANIPGYFPTPADIVADMIEAADIPTDEGCTVLEPSAGSGAIVDALKAARPLAHVSAFERHSSLRDVLELKGINLIGSDFIETETAEAFDYVLMNPPFENLQDIDHVRKAFKSLKPGGRLVAIMSPGPFFRSDRKAADFRAWFEALHGEKIDIPAGAFKASGTGVATVRIIINKFAGV